MKTLRPFIYQFLGVIANGDIGPYTLYTSQRHRFVIFLKTWPKDPATYHQNLHRNRWRHAGERWRNLDNAARQLWRDLARRANCTVTGYNLFIFYIIGKDEAVIATLERQTGIDVRTPTGPPIPYPAAPTPPNSTLITCA